MGCTSCKKRWQAIDPFISEERRARKAAWASLGVNSVELRVRALNGDAVADAATFDTPVAHIVRKVSAKHGVRPELVRLLSGDTVLLHGACLGDCVTPVDSDQPVELSFIKLPGPPVIASATSGRQLELLKKVPEVGDRCHLDREYTFRSLGCFAERQHMWYLLTSNRDKMTPASKVMWTLDFAVPATVHLNFRSRRHVTETGASIWLESHGFEASTHRSPVSTGIPSGPYSGPTFSKKVESGLVHLMGSECSEGTYFVFIEFEDDFGHQN